MPLDFFDITMTRETPACKIGDVDQGPHPFYVYTDGIQNGDRFVITKTNYNTGLGTSLFTHQYLVDRLAQRGESCFKVW
jgi:hypothetical protein